VLNKVQKNPPFKKEEEKRYACNIIDVSCYAQDANQKLTYAQMMKRERQAKAEAEIEAQGERISRNFVSVPKSRQCFISTVGAISIVAGLFLASLRCLK
jgi:hypothetical protein